MNNSHLENQNFKLNNELSCYLIGSSSLAIQCGQILINAGYTVLGVMSEDPKVVEWAIQRNLYCTDDLIKFQEKLKEIPFDYLFSIFNKFILAPSIIKMARQLVINCHDAPLPKYAGTNATSWAILNGETYHGITWHMVTEKVDAGDILQQSIFPIEANETSMSLNLKCYDHARIEFVKLIKNISENKVNRLTQDLQSRSFFKSDKKPSGNAFIHWNTPAEEIATLHRALDFGDYLNPLALPKFILGENIIIPKQISLFTVSTEKPGTIVEITDQDIEVATSTQNILLKQCVDLTGQCINLQDLATGCNIYPGYRLASPSQTYIQSIDEITSQVARYETFWVKNITQMIGSTSQAFLVQDKVLHQSSSQIKNLSVPMQNFAFSRVENKEKPQLPLLTLFLVYLFRVNGHQNLSLYFSNQKFKGLSVTSHHAFADFVPLTTHFDLETHFEAAFQSISQALEELEKHGSYTTDIFCRYPTLKNRHTSHWAFAIVEDLNQPQTHNSSSITIVMNYQGNAFRIFANNSLIDDNSEILANRVAAHLCCLIDAIKEEPKKSISYLSFFTYQELTQLQVQWNHTTASFPSNKTIVQLFEEQVLKTPDRIAVGSAAEELSYHALNVKANQLAHYLKRLLITTETLVAIYLDRSIDTIISILAILKTGSAYVPVDINHPKTYIQSILSNTPIIMTHHQHTQFLETCFSEKQSTCIVELDKTDLGIQEEKSTNLEYVLSPQNLAYVIHTSGSTGIPKGVLVEHRNVVNFAYSQIKLCGFTKESCVLAFASYGFDASVFEIFCSLLSGAKLYIAKKEEIMPGDPLLNTLQENKISIALISPIALDMTKAVKLPYLKTLISAGDACSSKINNQWNREGILFINAYGPTETTVFATLKVCQDPKVTPTIGKPIDNAAVYVLDQYRQLVPVGVIGELYIGGAGIARGYLNQPELTSEKFIPNPFAKAPSDPNQTLYKSGDLVRWLPNGDLEYIGRIDTQVKIRGYRIELSAIESILQTCSIVQQSVVITLLDTKGHRYIVAYVVPAVPKQNFDLCALRKYLAGKIPPYMVPQTFVMLDKLPINANGKVDKASLPPPQERVFLSDANYVAPSTEVETELAQVWSQVLNIEKVGIHDNFFNLGGHSLLVTEVLLHVKHAFKINISLKNFFDQPTISQLANLIGGSSEKQEGYSSLDAPYLKEAMLLPKDCQFASIPSVDRKDISSVLLSGASGFLGTHLLSDLYRLTTAKIFCLIRAKDYGEALLRINKNLFKYGFWELINSDRIILLLGDLSQKNLGVSEEVFSMLANEIDVIYHNGATVNHIYDFESLKSTNVDSTLEIIRLASMIKRKKIHFISALNAAVDITHQPIIKENFPTVNTTPLDLHNGYCQTKWVSERLLAQAKEFGLSVNIYRPSWISGQLKTGVWEAQHNHLLNFIKSCIQLGFAPNKDFSLEMWPVDCISKAIIQLSLNGPEQDGVYNFTNPNTPTWHELVNWLNKIGHPITFVSTAKWRRHCFDHMTKENALYPFASLYLQDTDWLSGLSQEKVPKIESGRTSAVLKSLGISYPNIDANVLKVYFDYLYKINFIQKASQQRLALYAGATA